ncbi:Protein HIRA [Hondaea fermentalgiana]|uniref:Protein HIRA n=1 Tax=Hondaea fermentalgiana TaxID=2315210 RepID=A0A2R5GFP8_9STRA|nr:Protein HIRA [Hondaea fermentalgiana]|eukprot:GBG27463.1 Protein HIRA [Hondaea fermentalgiana]
MVKVEQPESNPRTKIQALSLSPDGKRLATAGDGTKVKLWKLGEGGTSDATLLWASSVDNEVRELQWSPDGHFLASGDALGLVSLWTQQAHAQDGATSGFDSDAKHNVETWKRIATFRGHAMDTTGLSWAPGSNMIASSSIDNTIRVWPVREDMRTRNFNLVESDAVAVLKGHEGWAMGVAWDPVGRYIASVGNDKAVIIWRCGDWKLEAKVKGPFPESESQEMRQFLSWSPDGVFLSMSHAYDEPRNVGYVIERNKWKDQEGSVRLVGHSAPITVCAFSPCIYSHGPRSPKSTICAIACERSVLTLWTPGHNRPLLILRKLFERKVQDLSWSGDGSTLVLCSSGGEVACLQCRNLESHEHVGPAISKAELTNLLNEYYGEEDLRNSQPSIPETPLQFRLESEAKKDLEVDDPDHRANADTSSTGTATTLAPAPETKSTVESGTSTASTQPPKVAAPSTVSLGSTQLNPSSLLRQLDGKKSLSPASGVRVVSSKLVVVSRDTSVNERDRVLRSAKRPRVWATRSFNASGSGQLRVHVRREKAKGAGIFGPSAGNTGRIESELTLAETPGIASWTSKVRGRACAVVSNDIFTACATREADLCLFGAAGEMLLPPIRLPCRVAGLATGGPKSPFLGCVTCDGRLRLWNVTTLTVTVQDATLDPLWARSSARPRRIPLRSLVPAVSRFTTEASRRMGLGLVQPQKSSAAATTDKSGAGGTQIAEVSVANRASTDAEEKGETLQSADHDLDEEDNDADDTSASEDEGGDEDSVADDGQSDKDNRPESGAVAEQIPPATVAAFGVTPEGVAILILAEEEKLAFREECAAFAYEAKMRVWVRIADVDEYRASDFHSSLSFGLSGQDAQVLASIRQATPVETLNSSKTGMDVSGCGTYSSGRPDLELATDEPDTPETCDDEESLVDSQGGHDGVLSTLERRLASMDGAHVNELLSELQNVANDTKSRKKLLIGFFKHHLSADDSDVRRTPKQAWRSRRGSTSIVGRKTRVSQLSKETSGGPSARKRFGTTGALPRPNKATLIEMRRKQFYEGKASDAGDAMNSDNESTSSAEEEKDGATVPDSNQQTDHGASEAKESKDDGTVDAETKTQERLFEAPAILPTRPSLVPRLGGPSRAIERTSAMEPLTQGWPSALSSDINELDLRSAKAEPDVETLDIPCVDDTASASPLESTEHKVDDLIEWTQSLGMQSDDESLFDDNDDDDNLTLQLEE